MCNFLELSCPKIMVDKVVGQTHHTIHNTWKNLWWKREHLLAYNDFIMQYLSEYYDPMCIFDEPDPSNRAGETNAHEKIKAVAAAAAVTKNKKKKNNNNK